LRAALVGQTPSGLERLLEDVLDEVGVRLELVASPEEAEIAFALVRREDVVSTICSLKQLGIPRIVALLAVRDDRLSRRAIDAGAHVCYSLDAPVERLSFLVLTLLGDSQAVAKPPLFRLGPRGREVVQELRVFAARQRDAVYRIYADSEKRLELAIRGDYGRRLPRPFRLGVNGRLEATLMRLDSFAIERLERAIDADVEGELGRVA
jgi:hypothetical protein